MRATRRTLLKGMTMLPLAGAPISPALAAMAPARFVVDARLPGGRALASFARNRGHDLAEPRGEIVALFLADKAGWLADPAPLIGLTGYAELVLMRDLARTSGRPMRYAARWGGADAPLISRLDAPGLAFMTALHEAAAKPRGPRTGSFLWLA